MKILVEVPSSELNGFIEQIKDKNYQIVDDGDSYFSDEQIKILDQRKDTPKNQFITRDELKNNIRKRYAI